MKFNKKGQGALEYLLLIGGAVLIAVIVIALLVGMGSSSRQTTQKTSQTAIDAAGSAIPAIITGASCSGNNFFVTWSAPAGNYDFNLMLIGTTGATPITTANNPYTGQIASANCTGINQRIQILTKSTDTNATVLSSAFTVVK